ncbi:MAG: acyl-CoA thioesterase [Ignavibacteriae bacterium]|nr:acyl-CoA thioesterase [Ignavibacteriota bacterium]
MNKKNQIFAEIDQSLKKFKFKIRGKVKFHEVDSYGIVHNLQYFYWLEWARIEYLRKVLGKENEKISLFDFPVISAHNEIDYFNTAGFDDAYEVFTRISFIKNSSFGFENIIRLESGLLLAKASAVLVQVDIKTRQPERISAQYRELIRKYEGEDIMFLD